MRRHRSSISELRRTIDALPLHTRGAMLEAVRSERIIAGAYSDRSGGACPMLAAHRHGGRASHAPFARAWDRFTAARRPRRASSRELDVLAGQLEASISIETGRGDLASAIADHQALARGRRGREAARLGLRWIEERAPSGPQLIPGMS